MTRDLSAIVRHVENTHREAARVAVVSDLFERLGERPQAISPSGSATSYLPRLLNGIARRVVTSAPRSSEETIAGAPPKPHA